MLQHDADSALSDRQRKMIDEAEKSCSRIVALLGEMSELARLEAGTAALGRVPFDLFAALTDVAAGVVESKDRGVDIELRGASTGAPISGDAARMKEAFAALFRAVLREQPGSCTVVVDRRVEAGRAAVAIANQNEIERVWATPPDTFNEHRGGLGLALPIARRVVEHAGGRVSSVFLAAATGWSTPPAGSILVSFDLEQNP
jgi:signal transduction histidine kinase